MFLTKKTTTATKATMSGVTRKSRKGFSGCLALGKAADQSVSSIYGCTHMESVHAPPAADVSDLPSDTTFYRYADVDSVDSSIMTWFGRGVYIHSLNSTARSASLSDSQFTVDTPGEPSFRQMARSVSQTVHAAGAHRLSTISGPFRDQLSQCRKRLAPVLDDSENTPPEDLIVPSKRSKAEQPTYCNVASNQMDDTTFVEEFSAINNTLATVSESTELDSTVEDHTFNVTGYPRHLPTTNSHRDVSITSSASCVSQMSTVSSSLHASHVSSVMKGRGQVKLGLHMTKDSITVHVMEARNIKSRWGSSLNTYVQTQMIPDDLQRTKYKTQMKSGTNCPKYDEKLTYDMLPEEEKKRLMVSLWNREPVKNCSEFLGCMSFGLKHLKSKNKKKDQPLEGWYYLLSENMGHRKHLQVPQQQPESRASVSHCADANETENIYETLEPVDATVSDYTNNSGIATFHQVVIDRSATGYGFTIKGSGPVRVGRVKAGGPADKAGLVKGDIIIRINGQDARSETVDGVAKVIRESPKKVFLLYSRPPTSALQSLSSSSSSDSDKENAAPPPPTPTSAAKVPRRPRKSVGCLSLRSPSSLRTPDGCASEDLPVTKEKVPTPKECKQEQASDKLSVWGASISEDILGDLSERVPSWQPELSMINEERTADFTQRMEASKASTTVRTETWCPDLSSIPSSEIMQRFLDSQAMIRTKDSFCSLTTNSYMNLNPTIESHQTTTSLQSTFRPVTPESSWEETMMSQDMRRQGPFSSESEASSMEDLRHAPLRSSTPDLQRPLKRNSQKKGRHSVIQSLVSCEEEFCRVMKRTIQRLSRPLRHQILTSKQHQVLFQNLEKLVALSEYHICNMIKKSYSAEDSYISNTDDIIIDIVGSVYKSKALMLCEAYRTYGRGLKKASQLLGSLQGSTNFQNFLRKHSQHSKDLNMEELLFTPLKHLELMSSLLQQVYLATAESHPDFTDLQTVTSVVTSTVDDMNLPILVTKCQELLAPTSPNASMAAPSSRGSCNGEKASMSRWSSRDMGMSSVSTSSVDSEVLDLQQRLCFPEHVKPFHLANASRHKIFEGELTLVHENMGCPLHVTLCSDLLLLTQKQPDGQLRVIDEPILLKDIINYDFDCTDASEFELFVQPRFCPQLVRIQFNAPSREQKWAWKSILEQRIKSCRSQSEAAHSGDDLMI